MQAWWDAVVAAEAGEFDAPEVSVLSTSAASTTLSDPGDDDDDDDAAGDAVSSLEGDAAWQALLASDFHLHFDVAEAELSSTLGGIDDIVAGPSAGAIKGSSFTSGQGVEAVVVTVGAITTFAAEAGPVLLSLHLLYQELLLDVVQAEALHPLARLLCGLATALCSPHHVDAYLRDFGALDAVPFRRRGAITAAQPLVPFDIMGWLTAQLTGRRRPGDEEVVDVMARVHPSVCGRLRTVVRLYRCAPAGCASVCVVCVCV